MVISLTTNNFEDCMFFAVYKRHGVSPSAVSVFMLTTPLPVVMQVNQEYLHLC